MDEFLLAFVLGGAVVCTIVGMILTKRRRKPLPPEPKAFVICSLCAGQLTGLERFCPTCGKLLHYAVRSMREVPPFPSVQKTKKPTKPGKR